MHTLEYRPDRRVLTVKRSLLLTGHNLPDYDRLWLFLCVVHDGTERD